MAAANDVSIAPSSSSSSGPSPPSYSTLLHTLLTINTSRKIRLGVHTTRALLDALGPSFDLDAAGVPTIHVAGSNGKGSVATKIAKAFALHGLKVGLYTSPHISSYRERIQVDDEIISESAMCTLVPHILAVTRAKAIPATFFELGTALAFGHFIQQKVDLAVIEVGLGGRLDSTNVLTGPELTVITSIALEHTAWLGDTLEQITREKAGILKKDRPVLIGPNVDLATVSEVARTVGALEVQQCRERRDDYDDENSELARMALRMLEGRERIAKLLTKARAASTATAAASSAAAAGGVSSSVSSSQLDPLLVDRAMRTRPPCRFQRVRFTPTAKEPGVYVEDSEASSPTPEGAREVVLDVCHNPAAFARLLEKMKHSFPTEPAPATAAATVDGPSGSLSSVASSPSSSSRSIIGVVGFSSDKDFVACLAQLMQRCTAVYIVSADTPRAATVESVLHDVEAKELRAKYPACSVLSISHSPYTTLTNLLHAPPGFLPTATTATTPTSRSKESPVILCCGTFFIMADVRRALQLPHPIDEMQINEQSMKKT